MLLLYALGNIFYMFSHFTYLKKVKVIYVIYNLTFW